MTCRLQSHQPLPLINYMAAIKNGSKLSVGSSMRTSIQFYLNRSTIGPLKDEFI